VVGFLEDLVSGVDPHEGVRPLVPASDDGPDLGVDVGDAAVAAAVDGLPLDDGEPDL
jgi:hypothetical protein